MKRMRNLARRMRQFCCGDTRGSVPIEGVFGAALLLGWIMMAFEIYDAFRTRAVVGSATYTIADLISRRSGGIGPAFVNGSKGIFDNITHSKGASQSWMRVTLISCSASTDTNACDGTTKGFTLTTSYATGTHTALTQTTLNAVAGKIPVMSSGDTAVILETYYTYAPLFDIGDRGVAWDGKNPISYGLTRLLTFGEFVVTRPRGARTVWNTSL